jgi:hypothetical protein
MTWSSGWVVNMGDEDSRQVEDETRLGKNEAKGEEEKVEKRGGKKNKETEEERER